MISRSDLNIRRQQHQLLELVNKKNWHPHSMGMLKEDEYRARFAWLRQTLGEAFSEFEDLDLDFAYRWSSARNVNASGLVDDVFLAFREKSDLTMYVLRWN